MALSARDNIIARKKRPISTRESQLRATVLVVGYRALRADSAHDTTKDSG